MPQIISPSPDVRNDLTGEAESSNTVLTNLIALREHFFAAWQERAVTFTREEQQALKDEIDTTAALLRDLVSSS